MADRVGQQLGNYRLMRLLGEGGFAEVYLGEHVYLKTSAAIKLLQTKVGNEEDLQAFLKEGQTIAQLVHPHIVRVCVILRQHAVWRRRRGNMSVSFPAEKWAWRSRLKAHSHS